MKEKMERQLGLRAMVEVGEGVHRRNVDTEEHHDDEERSIRAQLEKLEEEIVSYHSEVASSGTASGPEVQTRGDKELSLCRLTQHRNKAGDVTSALAWDDLTGMKLDAGKVVEARSKEVTYIRD